jgi:hypothetical protein
LPAIYFTRDDHASPFSDFWLMSAAHGGRSPRWSTDTSVEIEALIALLMPERPD